MVATRITESNTSTEPDTAASTQVEHADRVVPLDSVFNFRDLGGYDLPDGRTTKWGRLFRADGLHRLSSADLDVVDALGIRTVIDLRTSNEIAERGTFPVTKYPVAYHHLSIIDATWTETGVPDFPDTEQGGIDFLIWAYRDMLANGADRFAHAIATLAVPGSGSAVFHCAAGKDRTGILAALILGALGVDHDVIAEDFGLSRDGMERMRAWLAAHQPESADAMNERPQMMFGAHPDAMRQILRDLVADHETIRGYLATIGIGDAIIADLEQLLTV